MKLLKAGLFALFLGSAAGLGAGPIRLMLAGGDGECARLARKIEEEVPGRILLAAGPEKSAQFSGILLKTAGDYRFNRGPLRPEPMAAADLFGAVLPDEASGLPARLLLFEAATGLAAADVPLDRAVSAISEAAKRLERRRQWFHDDGVRFLAVLPASSEALPAEERERLRLTALLLRETLRRLPETVLLGRHQQELLAPFYPARHPDQLRLRRAAVVIRLTALEPRKAGTRRWELRLDIPGGRLLYAADCSADAGRAPEADARNFAETAAELLGRDTTRLPAPDRRKAAAEALKTAENAFRHGFLPEAGEAADEARLLDPESASPAAARLLAAAAYREGEPARTPAELRRRAAWAWAALRLAAASLPRPEEVRK